MASAGGTVTLVQHMNHLAARIQAVIHKVDSLADQLEELRSGGAGGSVTAEAVAGLREDIRKDVIRERGMMEASLEHRIDQRVNRLMMDKDQTAVIARLEKRMEEVDGTVASLEARVADAARPAAVVHSGGSGAALAGGAVSVDA